jgi:hypothetical protein
MVFLQASLKFAKWAFMQASRRPPPEAIPAQFCLMSAAHTLRIAASLSRAARHPSETSLECVLIQSSRRPWPGVRPAHNDLISAAHALANPVCCAGNSFAVNHKVANVQRARDCNVASLFLFTLILRHSFFNVPMGDDLDLEAGVMPLTVQTRPRTALAVPRSPV